MKNSLVQDMTLKGDMKTKAGMAVDDGRFSSLASVTVSAAVSGG